jgi:peptidoglycan L-alanyl-D-glutamate endopeptidase CwlK
MGILAISGLLAALTLVVTLLAWIGWRFFVVSMPVQGKPVDRKTRTVPKSPELAAAMAARRSSMFGTVRSVVPIAVVALSDRITSDPLAVTEMERESHIRVALTQEHLVPPPSMPPAMFIGTERQALETADRDWSRLDPRFAQTVLLVLTRLIERGYPFVLLEGYRSPERQDLLAAMGNNVTNARAFQSKHQYGFAGDVAPVRDGRLVISEQDSWAMEAYAELVREAERAGLKWGGRWSFRDFGHIESPETVTVLAKLVGQ